MPGIALTARKEKTPGSKGARYGRLIVSVVAAVPGGWCRAVARRAVGVMAKTSTMVSLNCRTLLNPDEGDVCQFQGRGNQQRACGLGAACPGEGQRPCAEFVAEDPVQLAG